MIEREINLLSPHIIKLRIMRIYVTRLGHLVRFCIFLALLLLVVLGGVYVVVWWTTASLAADTTPAQERSQAVVTQVQRINAQLAAIKEWTTLNVPWTPLLPEVLAAMPGGIVLTRIGVDGDAKELTLQGTFPQREALVTFQRNLERLSWVKQVKSPLSNFETGTNAQWSLQIVRQEP